MLVWLASFPRSGNTFLRIVLHRLYGVRSSVIYDVDGVARRLGAELVGFEVRERSLTAMRASPQVFLVKTHRQRDEDVSRQDRAICLVRDGRDALVSWARQACERPGTDYRAELLTAITRAKPRGTGSWGDTVLSWLRPPLPNGALLRFEDLIADPAAEADRVVTELALPVKPVPTATIPSFDALHGIDPLFFRRGLTGTHREELPPDLHRAFWSRRDNVEAMALLGYGDSPFC